MLAHEIRNPLGSIRGTAEILKDDYRPGDRKYEFLEILLKEADRLNRVVEDFLQLARPLQVERGTCDSWQSAGDRHSLVSGEAGIRGVGLPVEPAELPPVRGDREKLRQVFLNLILTVSRLLPGGDMTISRAVVRLKSPRPFVDDFVCRYRRGDRPGGPGEIFEPFYTTKEGGTGLGLPITQKIVESHGGSADRSGQFRLPGRGTPFGYRVRLPL